MYGAFQGTDQPCATGCSHGHLDARLITASLIGAPDDPLHGCPMFLHGFVDASLVTPDHAVAGAGGAEEELTIFSPGQAEAFVEAAEI